MRGNTCEWPVFGFVGRVTGSLPWMSSAHKQACSRAPQSSRNPRVPIHGGSLGACHIHSWISLEGKLDHTTQLHVTPGSPLQRGSFSLRPSLSTSHSLLPASFFSGSQHRGTWSPRSAGRSGCGACSGNDTRAPRGSGVKGSVRGRDEHEVSLGDSEPGACGRHRIQIILKLVCDKRERPFRPTRGRECLKSSCIANHGTPRKKLCLLCFLRLLKPNCPHPAKPGP